MKKHILLSLSLLMGLSTNFVVAHAETEPSLEVAAKKALIDGKLIECEGPKKSGNSCAKNEVQYKSFLSPSKTKALVWAFGYPTVGTIHYGNFTLFKKNNDTWEYIKTYDKPAADFPAPKDSEVHFKNDDIAHVTYHFKKMTDANCCSTGIGHAELKLN